MQSRAMLWIAVVVAFGGAVVAYAIELLTLGAFLGVLVVLMAVVLAAPQPARNARPRG
jgi:hypothetical protein